MPAGAAVMDFVMLPTGLGVAESIMAIIDGKTTLTGVSPTESHRLVFNQAGLALTRQG